MRHQFWRHASRARLPACCAILLAGSALGWGTPPEVREPDARGGRWNSFRQSLEMAGASPAIRLDWLTESRPFDFDGDGPTGGPVVRETWLARGQSPDISLLPLARGSAPVETTSGLGGYLTPLVIGNGRLGGTYVTDFDETEKIGMQILTQGGLGAGIDAEVNYWQRPIAGLGREPLWTGDVNMMYGLSPISRFKLRAGAGGSWMVKDGQSHYGYNLTYGADIYTLWRFMFTGEIDYGKIDSDELLRYRAGLGLTFSRLDLFTGYESQKIGDERLDGWMSGLSLWY